MTANVTFVNPPYAPNRVAAERVFSAHNALCCDLVG